MLAAIVIGGGQHGLLAALRLAGRGWKVTLLEARAQLGGLCGRQRFAEGYASNGILRDEGLLDARAWRQLEAQGLRQRERPLVTMVPRPDGSLLRMSDDEVDGVGERDRARYAERRAWLARLRPALTDRMTSPPTLGGLPALATALRLRRLGRDDLYELMRVLPTSAADWLGDQFEDEALRAALALPALIGARHGPRAPWSAGRLVIGEARRGPRVAGGPAAVIDAAARAVEAQGVVVRTEAPVASIAVERGAVRGVALADGEAIPTDVVLATGDPMVTFRRLVGLRHLPDALAEDTRRWRAEGATAQLLLALDGPLELADGTPVEALRLPSSLDDLERAMDPLARGEMAERLALDLIVPSVDDPSLCPEGHAVVSVLAQGVPFDEAEDEARRDRLTRAVIAQIADVCPSLPDRVVAHRAITPADLAAEYRIIAGHLHHGDHAPDQLLFMRPSVDCSRYATPIEGLFVGGSGCHPGGGLTGTAGWLAAEAMIAAR